MSNDETTKNLPSHRIYAVSKNGEKKSNWADIGAVFEHEDENGFNLVFSARPLEGAQIVLRKPKAKEGSDA
jgi:hypothetical protein